MHRLTVHYGVPSDPETFDQRYADEHVPMVTRLEAVRSFSYSRVRPLGGDPAVYMVAELDFDDEASLKATLKSPEMGEAGAHAQSLGAPVAMYVGEVVVPRA